MVEKEIALVPDDPPLYLLESMALDIDSNVIDGLFDIFFIYFSTAILLVYTYIISPARTVQDLNVVFKTISV